MMGSHEGLSERSDEGPHIAFSLKSIWSDGTYQIVLSPQELLEKLAALVPPPRLNLVRYHGVLAPNAADARCAGQHAGRRNAYVRSGRGTVRKTGTPRPILGIDQLQPA